MIQIARFLVISHFEIFNINQARKIPKDFPVLNNKFKIIILKMKLLTMLIARLRLQALRAIGKDKVSKQELDKIYILLKKEKPQHLQHDMKLAPVWIADILKKALFIEQ